MNRKLIPVFFTIDESYAPFLSVALASLMENASSGYDYRIYVIYENLEKETMDKLQAGVRDGFSLEFVRMEKCLDQITDKISNRLRADYFTLTIYFRLFIADMFLQYDKGIYLDSDIVVPGDISRLYEIELDGCMIGACHDVSIAGVPPLEEYVDKAVGVGIKNYVNSGILLLNMKKLREERFGDLFLDVFGTYHFDSVAPDQDYLNALCRGRIKYLPQCWDVMPMENKPQALDPQIIHYNLFEKPWCYDGIQYEEYFWEYAKKTAFCEEIKQIKDNYTDEQKKDDEIHMNLMVSRARMISVMSDTFRTRWINKDEKFA